MRFVNYNLFFSTLLSSLSLSLSLSLTTGISYNKGSTVINMINKLLGPEKFRQGLVNYFKRHKYSNTETVDLWNAWSEVSSYIYRRLYI